VKSYRLTRAGRKKIEIEASDWQETTEVMARFLSLGNEHA
jgi:hypothetical protein